MERIVTLARVCVCLVFFRPARTRSTARPKTRGRMAHTGRRIGKIQLISDTSIFANILIYVSNRTQWGVCVCASWWVWTVLPICLFPRLVLGGADFQLEVDIATI